MSATDTQEPHPWSGSYRIALCPTCGREHPIGKRHCAACGKPSTFISEATDGLCLGCKAAKK